MPVVLNFFIGSTVFLDFLDIQSNGYNVQHVTGLFLFVITGLICVLTWPICLKNPFAIKACSIKNRVRYSRVSLYKYMAKYLSSFCFPWQSLLILVKLKPQNFSVKYTNVLKHPVWGNTVWGNHAHLNVLLNGFFHFSPFWEYYLHSKNRGDLKSRWTIFNQFRAKKSRTFSYADQFWGLKKV